MLYIYFLFRQFGHRICSSATEKIRMKKAKKTQSKSAPELSNSATDFDNIRTPISSILSHFHNISESRTWYHMHVEASRTSHALEIGETCHT